MGFGVWGLGLRVWGLGFGVWGLGFLGFSKEYQGALGCIPPLDPLRLSGAFRWGAWGFRGFEV